MCGIAGVYRFPGKPLVQEHDLSIMGDTLLHRGPDDRGFFVSHDRRVGLVHTRLSIIDLSGTGHQPMTNGEQKIWVVFNGEIYNFQVLKQELVCAGYHFSSESDTEVLIHGYSAWGIEGLLGRLRGMFAFALYDARTDEPLVFLCRDRFGIKPLYWYCDQEGCVFASEVRTLQKSGLIKTLTPDTDMPVFFLMFGHLPAGRSTWKEIRMLAASSYIRLSGTVLTECLYYDRAGPFLRGKNTDETLVIKALKSALQETVDVHLISDAPLGVFLSGGVDSSILVALASLRRKELVTLSVDFDIASASETKYQKMVSDKFHTDHRQICVAGNDFWNDFERIFQAMDQPTVDGVNTYFIARAARAAGLKTVLAGTGADEIFCGYRAFRNVALLRGARHIPAAGALASCVGGLSGSRWGKLQYLQRNSDIGQYLCIRGLYPPFDIERLLGVSSREIERLLDLLNAEAAEKQIQGLAPVDWLSHQELCGYLQNQLLKDADFMGMFHSVEIRVPYVDHVLLEVIARAHPALKMNRLMNKPLLVKAAGDALPAEIASRQKQGFMFPLGTWLRQSGREVFESSISGTGLHISSARKIWESFEHGRLHWSRVWALLVLGKWLSRSSVSR